MNPLHPDLSGRVAFITGGSRGIGKALALRLAREGADVAIAAKSEQSTEKLPGSIHETAELVRAEGRRALPIVCDVRDEKSVEAAVARTADTFGRIDIAIHNAGALWWQPVADTPVKRFDLMMSVNVRAAYLTAYFALPIMKRQKWGHLLGFTPPAVAKGMPGKAAYMASKLGIAHVYMGLAEEVRADNIAANVLWPRTIIESQASINWGMLDRSQWRTPEIVCDAAMAIFAQEPWTYSGKQLIDEEVLSQVAEINDFDRYWCLGRPPEKPVYIDGWF
ncbi:MAG: SDR family NAD(P)-dependent oxidoreductase [Acidobacteria bacterium]|nr:SDR family NAD(P)-dependent oxidoreductase [Acidobacteriota bacterium]